MSEDTKTPSSFNPSCCICQNEIKTSNSKSNVTIHQKCGFISHEEWYVRDIAYLKNRVEY